MAPLANANDTRQHTTAPTGPELRTWRNNMLTKRTLEADLEAQLLVWTFSLFQNLFGPSLPFPSLPFPSLPFPSLPFPSLPFPSLPFPSLPFPVPHPHCTRETCATQDLEAKLLATSLSIQDDYEDEQQAKARAQSQKSSFSLFGF